MENIKPSDSSVKEIKKIDKNLVKTLINSIKDTQERIIFKLFLNSGLTPAELINLTYGDFDFLNNLLFVRKDLTPHKIERTISIPGEVAMEIKNFANSKKLFLFKTKKSPKLTLRTLHRLFEKYSEKFQIKITPGNLRELYLADFLKENDSEKVKENLGYKRFDSKESLSLEEIEKIRSLEDKKFYLIANIILETGCELKELLNLKEKDFIDNFLFFNSNNKKIRRSKISNHISNIIKEFLSGKADNYLISQKSKSLTKVRVIQIIKDISLKLGIEKLSSKILRYTHIAISLSLNKSIEEISFSTGIRNLGKINLYGSLLLKNEQ